MVSFALPYPRLFVSAGITFFFSLSYPLLPGSWGYHGFLRSPIPSPFCFCGYHILFFALIPAAARLLGVSWFSSFSHTLACLFLRVSYSFFALIPATVCLLRVSHSFFRSHTRCCPAPGGIIIYFLISYPPYLTIFILSDIFLK